MKMPFIRQPALAIMVISSALAAAGCATYQPPQLPAEELAIIQIDPEKILYLEFDRVDGAYLSQVTAITAGILSGLSSSKEQKLLPGVRSVGVKFHEFVGSNMITGYSTLTFEAKAGQRYTVREQHRFQMSGTELTTWITDASGATVPQIKKDK